MLTLGLFLKKKKLYWSIVYRRKAQYTGNTRFSERNGVRIVQSPIFFLKSTVFRRRLTEGQGVWFPASRRASVRHRAREQTGRLQNYQIISDSLKALRYRVRPQHEIRRVQQGELVGVMHTKVHKESQNPKDRSMSLTGPEVELRSEGPITRNVTGVDAEYCRQPDSSPSSHFHRGATFEYVAGKGQSVRRSYIGHYQKG
jgi:hypothetical protein